MLLNHAINFAFPGFYWSKQLEPTRSCLCWYHLLFCHRRIHLIYAAATKAHGPVMRAGQHSYGECKTGRVRSPSQLFQQCRKCDGQTDRSLPVQFSPILRKLSPITTVSITVLLCKLLVDFRRIFCRSMRIRFCTRSAANCWRIEGTRPLPAQARKA